MLEVWKRFIGWITADPYLNSEEEYVVQYLLDNPGSTFEELNRQLEIRVKDLKKILRRLDRLGIVEMRPID